MRITKHLLAALALGLGFTACTKEDEEPAGPSQPGTYSFQNVDYSGQITRLDMLGEMSTYMKTSNTAGVTVDAQVLRDYFSNSNAPFSDSTLNNSTKQLKNKCLVTEVDLIESWMDSLANASQSIVPGSNGNAGVVVSTTNPSKQYLFAANGFEYTQLIEKGIMGAVFYYQSTAVYLGEDKMNVDNQEVTPGKGTAMQHHWDEAFGYLGAGNDFPLSTDGLRFHAKYCNSRDGVLGTNAELGEAFIRGRFAINQKDMGMRDAAIADVREAYELVIASTAIHYLNGAKADAADAALRNHQLSEAYAFIYSLKFNPTRSLSVNTIDGLLAQFGDNLYALSLNDIQAIADELALAFNLTAVQNQL